MSFTTVTLTNNAGLFFNAFPIESHFILVLDSLQCVARVNCLVLVSLCRITIVDSVSSHFK